MRTQSYPSDITDAQWTLIEPHLPVYPGGRPRKTNLRDVVDAIFYLLRTGCQWRYLPKDFPPKSTVWRYFDEWRHICSRVPRRTRWRGEEVRGTVRAGPAAPHRQRVGDAWSAFFAFARQADTL